MPPQPTRIMIHNAADITALHALGFRLAIWRSGATAWVDLIPHRGASLTMGIRGQFSSQALSNRLNRVLA